MSGARGDSQRDPAGLHEFGATFDQLVTGVNRPAALETGLLILKLDAAAIVLNRVMMGIFLRPRGLLRHFRLFRCVRHGGRMAISR